MRRSVLSAFTVTLLFGAFSICICIPASAQSSSPSDLPPADAVDLPSGVEATPEVWMYLHDYKRYQDPKEAVRQKAIARATQRQNRLESQRWYGHSKLRPNAGAMPQTSVFYGQQWGGLPWSPNLWTPYSTTYRRNGGSSAQYYYPSVRVANRR
jgi:hypothetical protein